MHTWIKFCGTTSLVDAKASIAAGADALGFIFAPSKRQVDASQARDIIRQLPAEIEKVGVFMAEPMEDILAIADATGLTGVQLHGAESSDGAALLSKKRSGDFRVIKTVLIKDNFSNGLQDLLQAVQPPDCILLDSGTGSGKTFPWEDAKQIVHNAPAQIIVAGGLTPENVGEAIAVFSPWGVDVVSGIEKQAGQKDMQKMNAFVSSVRKAEKK
jgi:phosphoribosylanthranilate isomerase